MGQLMIKQWRQSQSVSHTSSTMLDYWMPLSVVFFPFYIVESENIGTGLMPVVCIIIHNLVASLEAQFHQNFLKFCT